MRTIKHKKKQIPECFKPFLWSYDFNKLDIDKNKRRIILNLLNYGTKKCTDLLKDIYNRNDIIKVIENSAESEWDKKSLNYWSFIFSAIPKNKQRKIT